MTKHKDRIFLDGTIGNKRVDEFMQRFNLAARILDIILYTTLQSLTKIRRAKLVHHVRVLLLRYQSDISMVEPLEHKTSEEKGPN